MLQNLEMHKFPAAHDFLERQLEKGECLLLFYGLDELVGEDRLRIADEIKGLAVTYDRSVFLVTSRIEGYVRTSEILFEEAEIAPLDPLGREARSFVAGIIGYGDSPEPFLDALRSEQNLQRLAESPLLLSLIAFIYTETQGHLPHNRTRIYKTGIFERASGRDLSIQS
jgi:predicted NACHT family NTPase